MKAAMILKRGIPIWLLAIVFLAGCVSAPVPVEMAPAEVEGEIKRVIEVEADELTCHYLCQSFWAEEAFSAHLANQAQFKADFKQNFEQGLAQWDVSASEYNFPFDSATRSTAARCDIHDATSLRDGGEYYAQFEWLLRPLGLDFIDDNFQESETGLSWQGSINGIPISITLSFPASIGHCHAHAWWTTGG